MVARFVKFSGADPARKDEVIEWVRERVLPTLESQDGFAGYIGLYDSDRQMAGGITLWESPDALRASEEQANQLRQRAAEGAASRIVGIERYEVALAELGQLAVR